MSDPIIIDLPGMPRGKGRPRFAMRGGRPATYTDDQTASYEGALRLVGSLAMKGRAPLEGALRLSMVAIFPIPQSWSKKKRAEAEANIVFPTGKPDCDNLLKCIDGLNGVVFRDDAQITQAEVVKRYGANPSVSIAIFQK